MGDWSRNNYFGTAVLKSAKKADERFETLSAEKLMTTMMKILKKNTQKATRRKSLDFNFWLSMESQSGGC